MHEHVTFLRPQAQSPDARGITSVFPPEVLEQVRGRVRLLALLILVAFAFDLVDLRGQLGGSPAGYPLPSSFFETGRSKLVNVAAVGRPPGCGGSHAAPTSPRPACTRLAWHTRSRSAS